MAPNPIKLVSLEEEEIRTDNMRIHGEKMAIYKLTREARNRSFSHVLRKNQPCGHQPLVYFCNDFNERYTCLFRSKPKEALIWK